MPFALIIIGAVLLISAARNTVTVGPNGGPSLYTLLESDFTGSGNFIYWFVAILVIGAVGYIPKLKPLSVAFLTLVIIVLFLKRGNPTGVGGGFFSQILSGLDTTTTATPSATSASTSGLSTGNNQTLGSTALTDLLSGAENTSQPAPSPVASTSQVSSMISFPSLTPLPSSTDLSFPALGI